VNDGDLEDDDDSHAEKYGASGASSLENSTTLTRIEGIDVEKRRRM
jgi:hypothetical protein